MEDKNTTKSAASSEGGGKETKSFVASDVSKANAKNFRLIAIIFWIVAIGFEIGAILLLRKAPISTTWLVVLIVADLIFAVIGSLLWKKSNRFDPASEADKFKFFIQNQLGVIISIVAFLPLVILIFTNKNMSGKQKGIVGSIAVIAMLIAGVVGVDFNPPSLEQNSKQTEQVKQEDQVKQTEQTKQVTNGFNQVYWTKTGKSYHLYKDCSYINTSRTKEIFEGTIAQAKETKNITDLCDRCENRAKKEKGLEGK